MSRLRHPPDEVDLDRGMALAIMLGGCLAILIFALVALIFTPEGA